MKVVLGDGQSIFKFFFFNFDGVRGGFLGLLAVCVDLRVDVVPVLVGNKLLRSGSQFLWENPQKTIQAV